MMEASGGASMFADKSSATALKSLHRGAKNILYCYVGAQYSFATAKGLNVDTSISSASKGKDVVCLVDSILDNLECSCFHRDSRLVYQYLLSSAL